MIPPTSQSSQILKQAYTARIKVIATYIVLFVVLGALWHSEQLGVISCPTHLSVMRITYGFTSSSLVGAIMYYITTTQQFNKVQSASSYGGLFLSFLSHADTNHLQTNGIELVKFWAAASLYWDITSLLAMFVISGLLNSLIVFGLQQYHLFKHRLFYQYLGCSSTIFTLLGMNFAPFFSQLFNYSTHPTQLWWAPVVILILTFLDSMVYLYLDYSEYKHPRQRQAGRVTDHWSHTRGLVIGLLAAFFAGALCPYIL
eukprot:Phypoly_transcript_16295.p1 GENE.Phypoly_transcript_16295~~Phypoly_transcript_16295.p1  ORF type:complete len:257 (+),score=8.66 Phypoly_transcript_16295:43-813(+)